MTDDLCISNCQTKEIKVSRFFQVEILVFHGMVYNANYKFSQENEFGGLPSTLDGKDIMAENSWFLDAEWFLQSTNNIMHLTFIMMDYLGVY